MTETGDRLRLLFDWASAQRSGQRLALWLVVAILLHAGAWLLFRVTYPPPAAVRVSDATLYVLLPGSPPAARLAPFLAAADPALFAPEDSHGREIAPPSIPAYRPSYAVARPQIVPLPDHEPRILPPLIRDYGPVPISEPAGTIASPAAPAGKTEVAFSEALASRPPPQWPEAHFRARPGDELAPTRFLIAVAPDGRVLHVLKDIGLSGRMLGTENPALDDAASQFLMQLRFQRGETSQVVWGTATFHWGLDLKREELP
jgi:hypothetical protein